MMNGLEKDQISDNLTDHFYPRCCIKISAQQEAVATLQPKKLLQVQTGRETEWAVKRFFVKKRIISASSGNRTTEFPVTHLIASDNDDCNWVRDFKVPMQLGLNQRALCVPYQFMGALLL